MQAEDPSGPGRLAGVLQGIVWLTQILLLADWPAPVDSGGIGIWGT